MNNTQQNQNGENFYRSPNKSLVRKQNTQKQFYSPYTNYIKRNLTISPSKFMRPPTTTTKKQSAYYNNRPQTQQLEMIGGNMSEAEQLILQNGKIPQMEDEKIQSPTTPCEEAIINKQHQEDIEQAQDEDEDSQEAILKVGKTVDEIKIRKLIKEKLRVTKIPRLKLADDVGNTRNFNELYEYECFLGAGGFGFVVQVIEKKSGETMALKIVDTKSPSSLQALKWEGEFLQWLPFHQNIIHFNHFQEYANYCIMGIELAHGGTLGSLFKQRRKVHMEKGHLQSFRDDQCAAIIKGIMLGLKHLHERDYVHRDLKPSNCVIMDIKCLDQDNNIKLVDFGLAVKYEAKQGIERCCGTLVYQAPEQMAGGQTYGKAVDVWAAGLILYELIAGKHAIWRKGMDKANYKKIALGITKLEYGSAFTPLQKSLIQKLCHPKPSQRYTIDQALSHPWITRKLNDEIPRNYFEQNMYEDEIDQKLRKLLNTVYFLSVVRCHKGPELQEGEYEDKDKVDNMIHKMIKDKVYRKTAFSDYQKYIQRNSLKRQIKKNNSL